MSQPMMMKLPAGLFGASKPKQQCRLMIPREFQKEINDLRNDYRLYGLRLACVNSRIRDSIEAGDYDESERHFRESEELERDYALSGAKLVDRVGQIFPKIPVEALRQPCCQEHGLEFTVDWVNDCMYVSWKQERCESKSFFEEPKSPSETPETKAE